MGADNGMRYLRRKMLLVAVILFLSMVGIAATDVSAGNIVYTGGYYYGRGYYGGYYGSGIGIGIDAAYWGPSWYYPSYYPDYPYSLYSYPYYYPNSFAPIVVEPSTPPEYIEMSSPAPAPVPSGVWFYCPESKSYYPYIKECPGGWQRVPAQPPDNIRR